MFFLAEPGAARAKTMSCAGFNFSPQGEWRWSLMGLSGRDPRLLRTARDRDRAARAVPRHRSPGSPTRAFRCHGVMGQRQLHTEPRPSLPPGIRCADRPARTRTSPMAASRARRRELHGLPPHDRHEGASGRPDHRQVRSQPGARKSTGHTRTRRSRLNAMKNGLGLEPKHSPYLKSARLCAKLPRAARACL